jgi:hypothetical protein
VDGDVLVMTRRARRRAGSGLFYFLFSNVR